jgi:hypothetical protein
MKTLYLVLIVLFAATNIFADDFVRKLPNKQLVQMLTPEKFPNMDAVIVLKEQSFQIQQTEYDYRGITLEGPSIMIKNVLIVKLFNERAVKRYGNFEYNYFEYFGNEIPNNFTAHVRVMKADGKVWEMPEKHIQINVSRELSDGTPISRKVLFKVPDLAAGDVLQIEYDFVNRFSRTSSAIFYYNDRDFALYSNLYITLPSQCEVKYISLTEARVGEPTVQNVSKNFGSGKTYFWSLRNLNPIPDEPFSFPFTDQSLMTAFIIERWRITSKYLGDWSSISQEYYEDFLSKDKIKDKYVEELGFSDNEKDSVITFEKVNRLYNALRERVVLQETNSVYPLTDEIESIFKTGKGDASDLAYAMYHILHKWNVDAKGVWIRDKREGTFEKNIPTIKWFDRLGVLVKIDGKELLYDFDRCIPNSFTTPWFLGSIDVVVLDKGGALIKTIGKSSSAEDNVISENHSLQIDDEFNLSDSVKILYSGVAADEFRGKMYGLEENEINKEISNEFSKTCLHDLESLHTNNFWGNPMVEFDLKGNSASRLEMVENYITLQPTGQCLNEFRDELFSTHRRSHIVFNAPFSMRMNWSINMPEGYQVKTEFADTSIAGPGRINANFQFIKEQQQYRISLEVEFTEQTINVKFYPEVMKFLDSVINAINRDIILEKI